MGIVAAFAVVLLIAGPAASQLRRDQKPRTPKPEPVAETRLLMEGLNQANFRGLERILKDKPTDVEAWTFARGQALLISETGNLLMLRPPRGKAQDVWLDRAAELRDAGTALARAAARRDWQGSRNALGDLAGACNRCHQTFRVSVRVTPFAGAVEEATP
jgi:cytochrome c556